MGKFVRLAETNEYVLSLQKDISTLKELLKTCKSQWSQIQTLSDGSKYLRKNREEMENSIAAIKYAINDLSKALRSHLQFIEHKHKEVHKFRNSWKPNAHNYSPSPLRKGEDPSYGPIAKALEEAFK